MRIYSQLSLYLCMMSALASPLWGNEPLPSGDSQAVEVPEGPNTFRRDVVALAWQRETKIDFATGSFCRLSGSHYLVTAAHFAVSRERGMVAVYSRGSSEGGKIPITEVAEDGAEWQHFPDVDLSAIKLRNDHEILERVVVRKLPSPLPRSLLAVLAPVRLIGVPLLYGVSDRTGVNATVVRTEIANATVHLARSKPPVYLLMFPIDLPAGFSGGVVVDAPDPVKPALPSDEEQTLRGIIVKNTTDEKGGQFSVAVPAEVISRLLSEATPLPPGDDK